MPMTAYGGQDLSDTKYRDEAIARAVKVLERSNDGNGRIDAESTAALKLLNDYGYFKKPSTFANLDMGKMDFNKRMTPEGVNEMKKAIAHVQEPAADVQLNSRMPKRAPRYPEADESSDDSDDSYDDDEYESDTDSESGDGNASGGRVGATVAPIALFCTTLAMAFIGTL